MLCSLMISMKATGRILGVGQARVGVPVLQKAANLADLHVLQFRRVMHGAVRRANAGVLSGESPELLQIGHVGPIFPPQRGRSKVRGELLSVLRQSV